ncbi:lysophospholipid acyltransferase family protein [Noviherbaspirillum pedocola]|uniref:Lysophospholipid acyltransferase family protein n=1 Tax=Noviherbaspirillum pedocola TaxID=2801341 RepID=A0A934STQ2_9BURK|nr:lysophospholipid acyltransferase family protein [Noviherbaspirillum pedocola]MBK4736425.1 lysophospholipid acyltransferase family protein [Noviherbaspirillum pedocola]
MLVNLFRLLSRLPLPVLHGFGAALGWVVYAASPSYRHRLNENMRLAGHQLARRAAIAEAGKGALELAFVWCADAARVRPTARIENLELAQGLLAQGRGLIFLTPHLGCFEILAQSVSEHIPLTVLYRPPRKAALKPLVEGARERPTMRLAPANLAGVRMLLKSLKAGGAIGLLPDQVPQQGEGAWADFYGKPAYTMTLPAKLHQMSGAPVLLAYAERLPFGRGYLLRFVPFEERLEGSPEEQARAINAAMEKLIARCPSQYLWSYNRYKTPRGAPPPSAASASAATAGVAQ